MNQSRLNRPETNQNLKPGRRSDWREMGRLMRLFGPLIQIPLLWAFLQKPEWAARNTTLLYGGMLFGLMLVLIGIVLSFRK